MINKRIRNICKIGIVAIFMLILSVELRPAQTYHSSIFTTPGRTEIHLDVLANTMLPIDEETLARTVIDEEQRINGRKENPVYEVKIYRTRFHYYHGLEYGSLICDGNDSVL